MTVYIVSYSYGYEAGGSNLIVTGSKKKAGEVAAKQLKDDFGDYVTIQQWDTATGTCTNSWEWLRGQVFDW